MILNQIRYRRSLLVKAQNPKSAQSNLLLEIIHKNADTEFGRLHNFASIENLTDYRQRVDIHDYDSLSPYIEKQINGEQALTNDEPVYYARTSGTTGKYKDIPLTNNGLKQVSLAQKQLAVSLWQSTDFFTGKILGFAGAAVEGTLNNGCSYGSVSGTTYKSLSPIVASRFAPPPQAMNIQNVEAKYQAFALTVLGCDNLTGMVAANPSSVLKLVRVIGENTRELLNTLHGSDSEWLENDARHLVPAIRSRSDNNRIDLLTKKNERNGYLTPAEIFPNLSAIATWTGGSCGTAIRQLKPYLPESVNFVEYGYAASEFIGTVNVDAVNNLCLPQLSQHVYEFVEREKWEQKQPVFIGIEDLAADVDYYVFVTTQSGLYRYNINDIVRAGKPVANCPTLQFLQKGKGVTNITGEKVSEYQVIDAVDRTAGALKLQLGGYMMLANEESARYEIYMENVSPGAKQSVATSLDNNLRELNVEYDDKRNSGRLHGPVIIALKPGACEQIKQQSISRGVREAQFKPTLLDYARNWQTGLQPLVLESDVA